MRLLSEAAPLAVVLSTLFVLVMAAAQSMAHPPPDPQHGIDPATYYTLWSGDEDRANVSTIDNLTGATAGEMRTLAAATDIPLDSPPAAVEQWNRADLHEFPRTGASVSMHPPDAALSSGTFIRDAHASIFAVQPSTRARLSPSNQPLYVAPSGTLLGVVDYRVRVPPSISDGPYRNQWRLVRHEIVETRLYVDGDLQASSPGTRTPSLSYSLENLAGQSHSVTLEATISVGLRRQVDICTGLGSDGNCTQWNSSVRVWTEEVEVRDSMVVVPYELAVSGYRARYPNGDLGYMVYKSHPWLGHTLPTGQVTGVWRFYSARDEDWDTLVRRTATGSTVVDSPLHPLQVNAYPIESGPGASPRESVSILEVFGEELESPALPENVHLDVWEGSYTASFGIATRSDPSPVDGGDTTLVARGLVRGVDAEATEPNFVDIPIHRSNLTLTVLQTTLETVRVEITLVDAATGDPIDTSEREGGVVLQGEVMDTNSTGKIVATVDRGPGGISARYEPGRWWMETTGYVGDSDVVYVRGTVLHLLEIAYRILVPVSLFLLGVFIIDRITGWRMWPPWREL